MIPNYFGVYLPEHTVTLIRKVISVRWCENRGTLFTQKWATAVEFLIFRCETAHVLSVGSLIYGEIK